MLAVVAYNRMRVLTYARRWAFARNSLFNDYTGLGGDCTNFASQCLLAGTLVMNYDQPFGWYYRSDTDRAPAWTGVAPFYRFLTENEGVGPFGRVVEREELLPGDFVQLGRSEEDFYHTLTVLEAGEEIFVAAHTDDAFMRPLSSYNYALSRFLHVDGARVELSDENAIFYALLEGRALPPETGFSR